MKLQPTVIYEDADLVVINKPVGMLVHRDDRIDEFTVADWMLENYPESKGVGEPLEVTGGKVIDRPGVVHRLDRETGGVMVLAKKQDAYEHLKAEFHDRKAQKEYRAVVYGEIKEDDGVIDRPIARSKKDFRLWSAQRGGRGKQRDAVTEFEVIKRGLGWTYLKVFPKTGRTHQIRVHMKAIHHPIILDSLYAPKHEAMLGFESLALFAHTITLTIPSGDRKTFEVELPEVFASLDK